MGVTKIIKLTKKQLKTLNSGGTVGTETGISDDKLYVVESSVFGEAEEIGSGSFNGNSSYASQETSIHTTASIYDYDLLIFDIKLENPGGSVSGNTYRQIIIPPRFIAYGGPYQDQYSRAYFYLGDGKWFYFYAVNGSGGNYGTQTIYFNSSMTSINNIKIYGVKY